MSHRYKEARTCDCAYTTIRRSAWCAHRKVCKLQTNDNVVETELRERAAIDAECIASLRAQLADKDKRIAALEQTLRQTKKRKDLYAEKAAKRLKLPEPQRRKIAMREDFMCANPDGECLLSGMLEEYDIDHITPLWKGGEDTLQNMQALCPACHRRKTDRERLEQSAGAPAPRPGPEVGRAGEQEV